MAELKKKDVNAGGKERREWVQIELRKGKGLKKYAFAEIKGFELS